MKTEGCGGRNCNCCPPCSIIGRPDISKYPVLCQRCGDLFYVQKDGPDKGQTFTCGIAIENMAAGQLGFNCPYFKIAPPELTAILDADSVNEALQIIAALKARPKRAVILTGPESPHDFMDPILSGERMIRKVR